MLVMAVEAVAQLVPENRSIAAYYIKEADFISVDEGSPTETVLELRPLQRTYEKESSWSRISIFTYSRDRWIKFSQATGESYSDFLRFRFLRAWFCICREKSHGPTITEDKWDKILREAGFSGNDVVIGDYKRNDVCHLSGVVASKAVAQGEPPTPNEVSPQYRLLLVVDPRSTRQISLCEVISGRVSEAGVFRESKVVSFADMESTDVAPSDVAIDLFEMDEPLLGTLSERQFEAPERDDAENTKLSLDQGSLFRQGSRHELSSEYNLSTGSLRAMRSEALDRRSVTLAIESADGQDLAACAWHINTILDVSFAARPASPELEYVVRDGLLHTGRLYEEMYLNQKAKAHLVVNSREMLDTLEWVEDLSHAQALRPDEIEIEPRAWGLSFRDVFIALGRLEGSDFGYDCSGIVTRVGSRAELQPGDRMVMTGAGCMRSFPQAPSLAVAKVPDNLSLATAASIISPGIMAYYSLIRVAKHQKGEKILIHSASGSTGQMAIWIAKVIGAEIFATGVMRTTNGSGLDVVLNSLSGDGLRASDLVGVHSRVWALYRDRQGGYWRKFIIAHGHHIGLSNLKLASQLMKETLELVSQGHISYPQQLHTFSVAEVEEAFRFMQSETYWIGIDFRTEVAVFEIMGGTTIAEVGNLVADRGELVVKDAEYLSHVCWESILKYTIRGLCST
ncbi:hypothetical protein F5X99DRAFT_406260 [Biscogniauxia marginata]|nr:hypothetical protein F5X99DRAFT_406260 [Biscogniauxia marginata]